MNIVNGRIAPTTVNGDRAVEMGKAQLLSFEKNWPASFNDPIPKQIVTVEITKKSLRVGDKNVHDVNSIYFRVLGLQQSGDINLLDVIKHELPPLLTQYL